MKKIILALILLIASDGSKAQIFNPLLAAKLQDTLNKYVDLITNIKGMSAAVYIPGQGTWKGTRGNSYNAQPITSNMGFGIGSNTKLFVSSVILKLAENNILSLNDSLYSWIPSYPNINPNITIRQLLNHTSGIADPLFVPPYMDTIMNNPTRTFTPNEVLGWVGTPTFAAGTSWGYSNTNYIIAGMIAENATGYHISQLIRDSILSPLNLDSTFYDVREPEAGLLAHRWYNGVDFNDTSRVGLNTSAGCAGALFSNTSEMLKWYDALFSGQVLNATSLNELTTFVNTGGAYTYGLGLERQTFFGHLTYGHGGSTWGYKSRMIYDPCSGIVVSGLVNSWPAGMDGVSLLLYKVITDFLPGCPAAITGQSNVCQGQTNVLYTIPPIANATSYNWILPSGFSGNSSTNTISVDFSPTAVSGIITVNGVNVYGESIGSSISINVNNTPPAPNIIQNINTLQSDAALGNQWFDANGIIAGAVGQTFSPSADGTYFTIVTLSDCSSDTSNIINFVLTGIDSQENETSLDIFPNPVSNELFVKSKSSTEKIKFEIVNAIGQMVSKGSLSKLNSIDTGNLKAGIYILKLVNDNKIEFKKLIKEK